MLIILEVNDMSLWKLRVSMIGTLAIIIGLTTLAFTVILSIFNVFSLITMLIFVVIFNVAQWLFAPYIIDTIYRVKEISRNQHPKLYDMVERLSRRSGIKMPKVMLANVPIPNAFAYGSPIAGTRVAVTTGLLKTLEDEEVEAVIGHELGHLKHRDVQIMMFASILPALFYFIGYSLLWSSMWRSRDREGAGSYAVIGLACIALYWILQLFTLYLSRLREYYADRHSATIVDDGARKLQEGLAKIVYESGRVKKRAPQSSSLNAFKALFISDPDRAESDALAISRTMGSSDRKLVEEILRKQITLTDRIMEIFSTHPNVVKRIKALQELRT
jgi:heat shock protein HtpX